MSPALIDVSVLILFFNRPDQLSKVFEQVRLARPARLFLYQDGPRGERDLAGIEACRRVVEQVDWECEVHKMYQEKNYGCDPSEYLSQKWAFSHVDKCIVLEDDDVPDLSFFPFCKELLDRYENDQRITLISGFNHEEHTTDCGDDSYFFTSHFSIWGWASWRRVVDQWDEHYTFPYYETIFESCMRLSSGLAIMPRDNLVNNLGVTTDSTHFAGTTATLPRAYRRIFTMGRHPMQFPLHHPRHVIEHVAFRQRVYRILAWNHPWIKVGRSFEELWLNLRHGEFGIIRKAIGNRIRKWVNPSQCIH